MYKISDAVWSKVYGLLRSCKGIYTNNEVATRKFFDAVLYVDRSGCQWRMLPKDYGEWSAVYHRFNDWSRKGVWEQLFEALSQSQDVEYIMIDSTIMRAHACAAGAPKKSVMRKMKG